MKKAIILFTVFLFMLVPALADISCTETIQRSGPTSANGNYQITYTATGTSGQWGATIEESISGGCTFPSGETTLRTVMLSEDGNTKTISITAPSSGSCTITGNYQFGTCSIRSFNALTTNLGGSTCTDTSWSPSPSTVCQGDSFTQTSNCGNTRSATGTMDCSSTCTDTSWSPSPSTVCSGQSFTQTSNCGNTRSMTGTQNCADGNEPGFFDTCVYEKEDGTCVFKMLHAIGILAALILFSMFK